MRKDGWRLIRSLTNCMHKARKIMKIISETSSIISNWKDRQCDSWKFVILFAFIPILKKQNNLGKIFIDWCRRHQEPETNRGRRLHEAEKTQETSANSSWYSSNTRNTETPLNNPSDRLPVNLYDSSSGQYSLAQMATFRLLFLHTDCS